ncbi:MAG: glycosyltransferase family 2 protein [Desulfosporosinus sp.]|nr:glycosyltransferase family 2 protein [Desulfosporosinus sp.]
MISVIIPVYNGQEYIKSIVECFSRQLHTDFELIFINDGSKDDSLKHLRYWQEQSKMCILIVDQSNQGVSAARNVGINEAQGDWICFCDVDDVVVETYLSDMFSVITQKDVQMVFCKYRLVKSPLDRNENTNIDTGEIAIVDKLTCLRDFLYGRIKSGCWTIMVKREILKENDLEFAVGYKYSEDLHMMWRIIANCERMAYLDKTLYHYILQPFSATSKFNEDRFDGYELMKSLESYFENTDPIFSREYKKYGAAKIMWSIVWQASVYNDKDGYLMFIHQHNVKEELRKLLLFNNFKVSASSFIFLLSPLIFRFFANKYGTNYIH